MNETARSRGQQEDAALARVSLLGPFTIEWLVPSSGQEEAWNSRTSARSLLKLLLCCPGRQASRSQLAGILWPETDEEKARASLKTATGVLRKVLSTASGEELLEVQRQSDQLKLVAYPRLWVDVDAFEMIVQQASREPDAEKTLPLWQEAHKLMRGELLAEDALQEWVGSKVVKRRRHVLQAARRRMIRHLADCYVHTGQQADAEELLYDHLARFPADQDALYRLMKLLMQAECFEEAASCYERTRSTLAASGIQPAEHLQTLYDALKTTAFSLPSFHRSSLSSTSANMVQLGQGQQASEQKTSVVVASSVSPIVESRESFFSVELLEHEVLSSSSLPIHSLPVPEEASGDCATWFSERLAHVITFVTQWKQRVRFIDFQRMLDRELRVFDQIKAMFDPDDYFLSRREALLVIASLPKGLLTLLQRQQQAAFIEEDFLPACAASISACWYLLNGREFASVERALSRYLRFLTTWARQPSTYQKTTAYLASQGYLLLSLVASHRLEFQQRVVFCKEAIEYARASEDCILLVKALTMLGNALYDQEAYDDMLRSYQEAKYLVDKRQNTIPKVPLGEKQNTIPKVLHGKVLLGLAHAHAQHGQVQEALNAISQARDIFTEEIEDIAPFLSADDGLFSLILFEGWVRLDLGKRDPNKEHYEHAAHALAQIEKQPATLLIPERIRIEITNRQAQAAIALGNLEAFHNYTLQSAEGVKRIKSEKRRQELVSNFKTARQIWPREARMLELVDVLL